MEQSQKLWIIRQADVYAPEHLGTMDLAISNGKIAALAPHLEQSAEREVQAKGLIAIPGLVETHAHMLLPFGGTQTNNDFYDGTRAGVYGGVTTLIDFADQIKGGNIEDSLEQRLAYARAQCCVDYSFHCTLTDITEETLQAIPALIDRGFTSFKFYTTYTPGGLRVPYEDMERAFAVIARYGAIATVHAENEEMIDAATARLISAGRTAWRDFPDSKPGESEITAIERLLELQKRTGVRLLIRHVSSAAGAKRITAAQKAGQEVYGETCPHYLWFDNSVYDRPNGADYIVHPPIRTPEDREAIWEVLQAGAAFTIGTDDCAFNLAQKRVSDRFDQVPGGMPGIETRLAVLYAAGVATGRISLERLAELTSRNPAMLYGLYPRKGCLAVGSDADLVLLDPQTEQIIRVEALHEKADYTPFEGMRVPMTVSMTVSGGRILLDCGSDCTQPGTGRLLQRSLPRSIQAAN